MDVFFVVIQNLLLAGRLPLGIVVDRLAEAYQIRVSLALSQLGHFSCDTRYFLEPDLMHFVGWDADGGHRFHRFGVTPFPVSEAFNRKLGSSFRSVLGPQELGELSISGNHIVVNSLGDLVGQVFLVLLGKFRRKFFGRFEERVRGDDAVTLAGQLFENELGRHQMILLALSHHLGRLFQHTWDLM